MGIKDRTAWTKRDDVGNPILLLFFFFPTSIKKSSTWFSDSGIPYKNFFFQFSSKAHFMSSPLDMGSRYLSLAELERSSGAALLSDASPAPLEAAAE